MPGGIDREAFGQSRKRCIFGSVIRGGFEAVVAEFKGPLGL